MATGVFQRRESEPARKLATATKAMNMRNGADERRRRDDAHARNLLQATGDGVRARNALELAIDHRDVVFQVTDLVETRTQHRAEECRNRGIGIVDEGREPSLDADRTGRKHQAVLAHEGP